MNTAELKEKFGKEYKLEQTCDGLWFIPCKAGHPVCKCRIYLGDGIVLKVMVTNFRISNKFQSLPELDCVKRGFDTRGIPCDYFSFYVDRLPGVAEEVQAMKLTRKQRQAAVRQRSLPQTALDLGKPEKGGTDEFD